MIEKTEGVIWAMLWLKQEDDLKEDDQEGAAENKWWHRTWVRHMFVWVPILLSLCFLVAGIILVVFFRGRVSVHTHTPPTTHILLHIKNHARTGSSEKLPALKVQQIRPHRHFGQAGLIR